MGGGGAPDGRAHCWGSLPYCASRQCPPRSTGASGTEQHWGLRGREDHVSEAVWKSLVSAHLSSATIHVSGSTVWLEDRMLVLEMMPWLLPLGEFDRSFTRKAEKMFFHLGRHLPYSSVLEADKSIVLKVQV